MPEERRGGDRHARANSPGMSLVAYPQLFACSFARLDLCGLVMGIYMTWLDLPQKQRLVFIGGLFVSGLVVSSAIFYLR